MASKEICDQYAIEFAQRFAALVSWAKEHWPDKNAPLLDSDFDASRREIRQLIGERLEAVQSASAPGAGESDGQYIDMNPTPWP